MTWHVLFWWEVALLAGACVTVILVKTNGRYKERLWSTTGHFANKRKRSGAFVTTEPNRLTLLTLLRIVAED